MGRVRYLADVVLTCDQSEAAYIPGALDVEDGQIVWIGEAADSPSIPEIEVCDLGGLVMPGLINAHCHTPMTLLRGVGDGLPLNRWLTEAMWPREGRMTSEDAWWGMVLGSAEMLRAGVTTSCEMYLHEESLVDAVRTSGGRLVMTPGVLSSLHTKGSKTDRLEEIEIFYRHHHDPKGRITVGVAPHSAYDLGIPRVVELAELSQNLDTLLHIHLAETQKESARLVEEYGTSLVQILSESGVLDGRVLVAHCVWVSDTDLKLLKDHDVKVVHCPISNMKLGSGVAPLKAMHELEISVALGTDGPASNDTLNLWEEVKIAPLLARVTDLDATLLRPADVLAMATRVGGHAVGLDKVGCLASGWAADFQRIELDHHSFTPLGEYSDLLAHVAWSGCDKQITDVWVAGNRVIENGVVQTVDEENARVEVTERARRLAGI